MDGGLLALYSMNSYIRFGMEILMTNAAWPVTVPVTRLHYQILFISIACFIRLELTQDRLLCTITLTEENPVKHKKTSFRCTHGSCPVSSSTSAADIGRWSCLGSSPIEFLANGGLLLGFGFWHRAQTAHIPTDVQCLLCEYTIGLSHFYLTSLYFQKNKIKVIFSGNPEDGSSKGTEEQRLTGNRLSFSPQLLYLPPAPWITLKKLLKTSEICWRPLKE